MSAVETLQSNNPQQFIANKYIEQVLKEAATSITTSQDRNADTSIEGMVQTLQGRSYTVSNGTLELRHLIQQRFFDMKPRYGLPQIPIHNKEIWGEYNIIASKLAYGFLDTVKRTIAQQYNITING